MGGKLCTKFAGPGGKDDPTLHFDMGVQLLRPRGALAEALGGEGVAPWPEEGRLVELGVGPGGPAVSRRLPTRGLVVGVPSMSAVGHRLLAACGQEVSVITDRTAWVGGARGDQWHVQWGRAKGNAGQIRTRPELAKEVPDEGANFDAVVHAYEANKIRKGCATGYKAVPSSATTAISQALRGARTCQVWNLMIAFESPAAPDLDWDAAFIKGHRALAWLANDSSKPMRSRVPDCWMAFSTLEWAQGGWSNKDVEVALVKEVCKLLGQLAGRSPPKVVFAQAGRWGNSTASCLSGAEPIGEFPARCLAQEEGPPPAVVWEPADGMGACGDWAAGFSVCDAFDAGVALAGEILQRGGTPKCKRAKAGDGGQPTKEYRTDPGEGGSYTRAEFVDFYGQEWKRNWDAAKASSVVASERPGAAPERADADAPGSAARSGRRRWNRAVGA